MKKLNAIAGVILSVSMGQGIASAPVSTTGNNFSLLDGGGGATGGTNDVSFTWDETYQSQVLDGSSNATIASPTTFFGVGWTATDITVYGPGTYSFDANCPAGLASCIGTTINYSANSVFANSTDSFTYTLSDDNGGLGTATVNVTINPVNDFPVLTNDFAFSDQDASVTFDPRGNDSDEEGDTFSIVGVETNLAAVNGSVTFTGSDITYTPDLGFFGTDIFTYDVDDGNGGLTTGSVSKGSVTVVVKKTGAATPGTTNYSASGDEDTNIQSNVSMPGGATALLYADPGVNGVCGAQTTTFCLFGCSTTHALTFKPNTNFNGVEACTIYFRNDDYEISSGTATFTVNPLNDAPQVTSAANIVTSQDNVTPVVITPTLFDVDGDTVTITGVSNPAGGTTTFTATTVSYVPDAGFFGLDDPVTITVDDGTTTGARNIKVAVNQTGNLGPTPMDDALTIDEGQTIKSYFINDNDTDPEGDPLKLVFELNAGTEGFPSVIVGVDYSVTVPADHVGAHMLFNWSGNTNIDVFNVWQMDAMFGTGVEMISCGLRSGSDCGTNTSDAYSGDQTNLWNGASIDIGPNGVLGLGMVDGPFQGFSANFNVMGVYANTAPAAATLIAPEDGDTAVSATATVLAWDHAVDPNTDPLTYDLTYCEDMGMTTNCVTETTITYCDDQALSMGCVTTLVASVDIEPSFMLAGLGSGGLMILGLMGLRRRQKIWQLLAVLALAAFMHACSSSGGGAAPIIANAFYTPAAALNASTSYYWKITAVDVFNQSTDSAISSFTTQ